MKILYTIWVLFFFSILVACDDSGTESVTIDTNNPFSNGSSERNMIVVISDLHLGADLSYAEINNNLPYLEKFIKQVKSAPNVKELVIAGDMLDEWFVPANVNTYQGKNQLDFVRRIAASNKGVIDAINSIINEKKILVTYVPGNHDLTITAECVADILPGINQARDEGKLGLGTYSPSGQTGIAIEHGHRYNFFCAPDPYSNQDIAPGSILPPGYFFTRLATLHVIQKCTTPGEAMKIVTPNSSGDASQGLAYVYWKIWEWAFNYLPIQNKYDEKIIVTNINGHTATYSANDIIPFQTVSGGAIDMYLYKGIQDHWADRQTYNNVQVKIPTAQAIQNSATSVETDNQATAQYFANSSSNKRLVIMGHSHVAKLIASTNTAGLKAIYANSGTWIDHNSNAPTMMNFVVIIPQNSGAISQTYIKLYNYQGGVANFMAVDSLRL